VPVTNASIDRLVAASPRRLTLGALDLPSPLVSAHCGCDPTRAVSLASEFCGSHRRVPWFREFAGIDTDRVDDERSEPAERPGDGEERDTRHSEHCALP
jgi:hypothetical protein